MAVELSADKHLGVRVEESVFSIVRWAARRKRPFQLVFPVNGRNLDGVSLLSPYIWMRAETVGAIGDAVSPRRGRAEILRDNYGQVIPIEDSFVQEIIKHCRTLAGSWSAGIRPGNYARILFGRYRMFCGKVIAEQNGMANLELALRARTVSMTIPVSALENLGRRKRDYFYTGP